MIASLPTFPCPMTAALAPSASGPPELLLPSGRSISASTNQPSRSTKELLSTRIKMASTSIITRRASGGQTMLLTSEECSKVKAARRLRVFLQSQSGTFGMKNGGEATSRFCVTKVQEERNMVGWFIFLSPNRIHKCYFQNETRLIAFTLKIGLSMQCWVLPFLKNKS